MNFGILVFDEVEELDFAGPWEMLTMWGKVAEGPSPCLIVAQNAGPVRCAKGLSINPHVSFADCPPLDYLLVPGGQGTRREVNNPVLLDFVAAQARQARPCCRCAPGHLCCTRPACCRASGPPPTGLRWIGCAPCAM